MLLTCGEHIDGKTVLSDVIALGTFLDSNPCASATALMTYLIIEDITLPRDPAQQEKILEALSIDEIVNFEDVLHDELHEIGQKCSTHDLDIIFVLDSSGSVTIEKWTEAMNILADKWILTAIKPSRTNTGNNVLVRSF